MEAAAEDRTLHAGAPCFKIASALLDLATSLWQHGGCEVVLVLRGTSLLVEFALSTAISRAGTGSERRSMQLSSGDERS